MDRLDGKTRIMTGGGGSIGSVAERRPEPRRARDPRSEGDRTTVHGTFEIDRILTSSRTAPGPAVKPHCYVPNSVRVSGTGGRIPRAWCGLI